MYKYTKIHWNYCINQQKSIEGYKHSATRHSVNALDLFLVLSSWFDVKSIEHWASIIMARGMGTKNKEQKTTNIRSRDFLLIF
jgi:hypothetical protein